MGDKKLFVSLFVFREKCFYFFTGSQTWVSTAARENSLTYAQFHSKITNKQNIIYYLYFKVTFISSL